MFERKIVSARVGRDGVVSRREFIHAVGLGTAGLASLGWHDLLLAAAPAMRKRSKSIIVLWMQGGPSQFETFDPKPGTENGGATKAIATSAPGVQVAEFWPSVAKQMNDVSLIRSMTNKEGNHQRATYQLHTGYAPSGSVKHPSFGALMASELADPQFDLPSFVSVIGPSQGPGFLPVKYTPFRVQDPTRMPANTDTLVQRPRYDRRLALLSKLEQSYARGGAKRQVEDHQALYGQASGLVKSPRLSAFDISQEKPNVLAKYGDTAFGKGCLLARRLVEVGVTYVEVQLGNWDTHQDNNERIANLAGQCDPAFAALIADLKDHRLLDDTLVVWMGEFGRTPRMNPRAGRDHYPRAFNVAVAGGGIAGGKVVGRTNEGGTDISDRPVSVNDLFHTICSTVGVNPAAENQSPLGRPMKIVDGGSDVKELLA